MQISVKPTNRPNHTLNKPYDIADSVNAQISTISGPVLYQLNPVFVLILISACYFIVYGTCSHLLRKEYETEVVSEQSAENFWTPEQTDIRMEKSAQ
jgi:hypothetical protein